MISFEFQEFESFCKTKGYAAYKQTESLFYIKTSNSVKHEVKFIQKYGVIFVMGFGRSTEDLSKLRDMLTEAGYTILNNLASKAIFIEYSNLDDFIELAKMIEDLDIEAKNRSCGIKVFSKDVDETNKFEKIAKRYFYAIENEDQEMLDLARVLLSGDSIDNIITRGESVSRTENNSYREHIVPCIMIHNEAIRMVLAGYTKTEVAQMIATNLAIVRITNEEADLLDNKLKLKMTMPEGWKFGDNVFARLDAAKIICK
jgi:hypothetical protein